MNRLTMMMILPAAMVPVAVLVLRQLHVHDGLAGLTVGVLIGLSLVGGLSHRQRKRYCRVGG
ncbi:hypothetical protein [Luteibacter sahnii]|uniref:hypothetical protein n=1 Tax=Luteibacter sahnii TaxID=3021977 RepID=UPI002A698E42|nr:hypothetical protein [Luteibacter sp. PPL193]MDY1547615.1 hypothetical protein [Luteibacter sp. PPL193]